MATKKAASKVGKKGTTARKTTAKKTTTARKGASAKTSQAAGKCTGWKAVHDYMPPLPARLRVTGKCRFSSSGHTVTLKDAVPQGINPFILLLRKTVTQKPGIQIPETVDVKYTKKTNTHYTHVTILPDGVTIKVQEVH